MTKLELFRIIFFEGQPFHRVNSWVPIFPASFGFLGRVIGSCARSCEPSQASFPYILLSQPWNEVKLHSKCSSVLFKVFVPVRHVVFLHVAHFHSKHNSVVALCVLELLTLQTSANGFQREFLCLCNCLIVCVNWHCGRVVTAHFAHARYIFRQVAREDCRQHGRITELRLCLSLGWVYHCFSIKTYICCSTAVISAGVWLCLLFAVVVLFGGSVVYLLCSRMFYLFVCPRVCSCSGLPPLWVITPPTTGLACIQQHSELFNF